MASIPEKYHESVSVEIFWFITVISALISTLICFILIMHLIRLRIAIIPKFDSLTFYVMMIIYFSFFICSLFAALFRSNIIISISSFPICTHLILTIYQLFWCFGKLFTTLYYIYRIHIIFEHSTFQIQPTVLMIFTIFTVFSGCIGIILVPLLSYNNIELAVSKHHYKHCQINDETNYQFTALLIIEGVLHGIVNIILIYLFLSRLFMLIQTMIPISAIKSSSNTLSQTYNTFDGDDQSDDQLSDIIEVEESTEISREISKRKSAVILKIAKQSFMSMSESNDKKKYLSDDLSQKRVEMMTRLMSKQTILVILYILSTSLIFFGQIIFGFLAYLLPFDIIINVLCIWFSLKYSDVVWNILIKGCCTLCCWCWCCKCCPFCTETDNVIIQRSKSSIHIISEEAPS